MFENLSSRLGQVVKNMTGQGRLTEANIQDALRDVRMALLEADVALPIVRTFVANVKEAAIGVEVIKSLSPGQAFIKVVNDELVKTMGAANESLNLNAQPPATILMAGLQGAGKTTTAAKLAKLLKERHKKKVMLVSCDIYRPAAIKQLQTLAAQIDVAFFPSDSSQNPVQIAQDALAKAKTSFMDVLIIDTAGRLHIDEAMMAEIKNIHAAIQPTETLFTVDSMTGQDAANTAKAFNDALALTGVILTKTDGDARGGAALSIRQITGKPIKFIGAGEKVDALQPFHPDRIASRILGMGDVLSLVEDAQQKVDMEQAAQMVTKLKDGKGFDMNDLRAQLLQMQKMGGMTNLMDKLPGMGKLSLDAKQVEMGEKNTTQMLAIINSMTPQERRFPELIRGSRKKRIAAGSGTSAQDINRLLKQHMQMKRMMRKFSGGGLRKMMRAMQGGGLKDMFSQMPRR